MTTNKKYRFHVNGMHCAACVVLTESELRDLPEVDSAKASLQDNSIEVTGDFGDKTPDHIAQDLTAVLKPHGYTVSLVEKKSSPKWRDFVVAIPLALAFVLFFILLQKLGLVNMITTSRVDLKTAFIIGIVASLSSCMAVVGGLVLSMASTLAREGDKVRPQVLFHGGRLISFFILGGVIGAFGAVFRLSLAGTFVLNLVIAFTLLVLGINLLDIMSVTKKLQPTLPSFLGRYVYRLKNINHTLTPVLVGIATFFLPCGFTQSMQLYTLSTGNFWVGAFTMSAFALGTLPVLSLLSFSSLGIKNKTQLGIFFKTAGLIVIFFAILNIINALVIMGFISPIISW